MIGRAARASAARRARGAADANPLYEGTDSPDELLRRASTLTVQDDGVRHALDGDAAEERRDSFVGDAEHGESGEEIFPTEVLRDDLVDIDSMLSAVDLASGSSSGGGAIPDASASDRSKFYHASVEETAPRVWEDQSEPFQVFEQWLGDRGAKFPFLESRAYTNNVRGVHASCAIPADEIIMQIPLSCIITDKTGMATETGRLIQAHRSRFIVPHHLLVIAFMMEEHEKGPVSEYWPYLAVLPVDTSNFPVYWSEEELAWLQGSSLLAEVGERRANFRADYDAMCRVVPGFERFEYPIFQTFRTMVASRNFTIYVDGAKRTAMVPHADMLNHYRPRETSWTFSQSLNSFTMTSLSPLVVGQQVMDSYGKKCNSRFLLHYGFAIEENTEEDGSCPNEVPIRLKLEMVQQTDAVPRVITAEPGSAAAAEPMHITLVALTCVFIFSYVVVCVFVSSASPSTSPLLFLSPPSLLPRFCFCVSCVSQHPCAPPHPHPPLPSLASPSSCSERKVRSGWQRDKTYNLSTNASDTDTRDAERYARRVACNDDAELRAILANGATRPISAAHALRSLQVLAFACQEQLDRYPSSLASDDRRIASGELKPFSNERNALVVVRGEKRICRMYVCHVAGRACAGAFRRLRVFLECCAPGLSLSLLSLFSLFSLFSSLFFLSHTRASLLHTPLLSGTST